MKKIGGKITDFLGKIEKTCQSSKNDGKTEVEKRKPSKTYFLDLGWIFSTFWLQNRSKNYPKVVKTRFRKPMVCGSFKKAMRTTGYYPDPDTPGGLQLSLGFSI